MLCSPSNESPSSDNNDSDIFHNTPVQQSTRTSNSLPSDESNHLLDSLSTITSLESGVMPSLLVTSTSQGLGSDLLQAANHENSSAFQIPTQSASFAANCGISSVSSWMTNNMFKTSPAPSDNVQSSGILPPVTEIYSATRNNGGLRLLGLRRSSEIMPSAVLGADSNEVGLNPSRTEKLHENTQPRTFATTEALNLANASSSTSSPFQVVNKVRVSPSNAKQLAPPLSPNSSGQVLSLSSSLTVNMSCLSPSNGLIPLVMNGHNNNDGASVTSIPSGSSSLSNNNVNNNQEFDLITNGNRIPTHMPLPQLESLIHDSSGVGSLQSAQNNLISSHLPAPVNVPTPPLPSNNSNSTLSDIAMPNTTLSSNSVSLQFSRLLCLQTPETSQDDQDVSTCDDLLNSAIEETICFKCKFCTFISLNKSQVVSHIKMSHTKSSEIIQLLSSSSEMKNMNRLMTLNNTSDGELCSNVLSNGIQPEPDEPNNFANLNTSFITLSSKNNSVTTEQNSTALISKEQDSNASTSENHFFCGKCRKGFATLKECKYHLTTDHSVKLSRIRLEHISSPGKGSLNKTADTAASKNKTKAKPKTNTTVASNSQKISNVNRNTENSGISHKQSDGSASKTSKKSGNTLKKTLHIKLNGEDGGGKLVVNVRKKGEMSSLQKAWQKKMKREQGLYICEYKGCNVRFRILDNLEYHRKCHIAGTSAFACPECGFRLEHWGSTAGHLWRQHVVEMELHACDICSYRTYSLTTLENLHKRIHRDERPYMCDICGKRFKTIKQLKNHKSFHLKKGLNNPLRIGECAVCYRRFTDKRMLRSHLDTVHNKLRPFLCNYCGYSASSKSTLKMHMRQHTGEKPFACELCSYRTSDHNSLRRHKMRHSGEKPYKCPYCTYACIQASTYKTHLKNKHPGQDEGLLFSCTQCSFRTIKQENYLAHIADHQLDAFAQMSRDLPNSLDVTPDEHRTETLPLVEAMGISLSHGDKEPLLSTSSLVTSGPGSSVFNLC